MAVMTSEHSERVAIEQKTQPVPSSEKMALDLDINGTSIRDETTVDLAPSDLPLISNSISPPSNEVASLVEVNGSPKPVDAVTTDKTSAASSANETLLTSKLERVAAEESVLPNLPDNKSSLQEPSSPHDAPVLPDSTTTDLSAPIDTAIEAALEDNFGASSVLPVIDAQQSDIRHSTPPAVDAPEPRDDMSKEQSADIPLLPTDEVKMDLPTENKDVPDDTPCKDSTALEQTNVNSTSSPSNNPENTTNEPAIDTEMVDAPSVSQASKVSREREDDDEEVEPSAKRTKVEEDTVMAEEQVEHEQAPTTNGDSNGTSNAKTNGVDDHPITSHQSKEIVKVLKNVIRSQNGKNFRLPVATLWPTFAEAYSMRVPNEIDLSTIEKRVKDRLYSSWAGFKADVDLLRDNAILFNGADHLISKAAQDVHDNIISKTANIPTEVAQAPPRPTKKAAPKRSTPVAEGAPRVTPDARRNSRAGVPTSGPKPETFALDPSSGTPLIRRDSTKLDGGRPKREIHPPKNKDLPYNSTRPKSRKNATELKFCEIVLMELKKPKHQAFNIPFLIPVDPVALGIPNYFSVIKNPMDLQTITERLHEGYYQKMKDFEGDVRLLLNNCFKFNPPGNPVNDMGKQMEALFNTQWERRHQWMIDHAPAAQSPSSAIDSEEEESEEEVEPEPVVQGGTSAAAARLIDEQQKLIKMMTSKTASKEDIDMQQDIVQMIQMKVHSEAQTAAPKKAAKKNKAAPNKQPVKKSGGTKKDKSGGGARKSGSRPKYMGTIEKEIVSAGIGLLPDQTQDRVMAIIQGDAPDAKADEDGALELDIDSLTEASLWEIYGMIEKHLPATVKTIRDQKDAERMRARAPAPPKQKKKNKPMSKNEQERKIDQLKNAVQELERNGSGSQEPIMPTVEQRDDTSGDETSDSEEE